MVQTDEVKMKKGEDLFEMLSKSGILMPASKYIFLSHQKAIAMSKQTATRNAFFSFTFQKLLERFQTLKNTPDVSIMLD